MKIIEAEQEERNEVHRGTGPVTTFQVSPDYIIRLYAVGGHGCITVTSRGQHKILD